ncbi:hypothetical protein ACFTY8_14765 [Streptomyces mirabilis]|uniref:hypothetical protein n=1 Tax=Streptomyces mirabilis TaxID=68239 RepID=UPI00363BC6F4
MHRIRRQVAMVALTALALMLTTQQAVADGRELGRVSLSMPSLSSVVAWFQDPTNSVGVDFGAKASDSGLVSFAADSAHSLSYGLKGAASVKGTADGSRVTYENVLTDTDLQVAPTATGVKDAVVLRSADAGNSWTFPLDLKGLTPVRTRSGSIDLRDSIGRAVERIPASYAYDSGEPALRGPGHQS